MGIGDSRVLSFIVPTNPPIGSGLTYSLPSTTPVYLRAVYFNLTTKQTVGNRFPIFRIHQKTKSPMVAIPLHTVKATHATAICSLANTYTTSAENNTLWAPLPEGPYPPTSIITITVLGMFPLDKIVHPRILYEF